jgi:flagellar motor switch protein FliM
MSESQLSQAEINALIAGAKGADQSLDAVGSGARVAKAVKTYDFRRPDKFSKDQLRTLQAIHETIGRVAGGRLTDKLRTAVTMTLADTSQMIFDEYVSGLSLPTLLFPMNAPQLSGPFLLDLDLALALGWVDRLLGGAGELPKERREPTPIEGALIHKLVDEILPAIAEGWSQVETVTPAVEDARLGPSMLRVAAPSDVVAVMTFEVRYPGTNAPMSMCLPYNSLEAVMSRLSATTWYAQQRSVVDGAVRAEISSTLQIVEVPLTAVLGGVELTVDELASLKPGDVIRFSERADHPVRLSVMDQAMAWAAPGRVGDHIALRLLTPLQQLMEA